MKLKCVDIETPTGCFLLSAYDLESKTWEDFLINKYQNDLPALQKWLLDNQDTTLITYNGLSFDGQVIEYILRESHNWSGLDNLEISKMIWQYGDDVIDDGNYSIFPPFREHELNFKQIDVFKIQHFDNKNRRVGLKRLEYEMGMENIEEMGIPPTKVDFTEEEVEKLIYYCHNDVYATYLNYLYIIGEVEHELYKGNNQLEIREAIKEQFGINCINYSNSKYGDEIIKTIYCKEMGIDYKKLPKKGTFRKSIKLKYCVPSFIEFKTKQLQTFLKELKGKELQATEKFEEEVDFMGQTYSFMRGGIHNKLENKQYHSDDEYIILDLDVTSYYPATILNNKLAPHHLNKEAFYKAYEWIYNERIRLKPLAKDDKKIKGIVAGYKEAAVSVYGKSGDPSNWLFDIQMMLTTCIAGELSILMLIEQQELDGSKCIMANTDGATFYIKRSNLENFNKIAKDWSEMTKYQLEYVEFKSLWFLTVNSYLGIKSDGTVKKKDDFLVDRELHKKNTFRIIPLTLSAYFIDGIEPEEFIANHKDVRDFCNRSSGGKTYYHEGYKGNSTIQLPNLIRFYVSKEGILIRKMVKETCETNASDMSISPENEFKTVINRLPKEDYPRHLENIKTDWYIKQVRELIFRIDKGRKPKKPKFDNPNQGFLF